MIDRVAMSAAVFVCVVAGASGAAVIEHASEGAWTTAAGGTVRVISFDDEVLAPGASLAIASNRYAALAGSPSFVGLASVAGSGDPYMYYPSGSDNSAGITPTSGQNLLQLNGPTVRNGKVRITFSRPVVAVSGRFIDIETSAAAVATGFRVDGVLYSIDLTGPSGLGRYFGIVSDTPFTTVDLELHPNVFPIQDGLALDDFKWVLASDCVGDVNGDGFTNSADFNILAGNFGNSVTPGTGGDLTGDGIVNSADFNVLAGDFGCG